MNLKYDVEADWTLLTTCNFRCAYCPVSPQDLGAKLTTYGTAPQWAAGFAATAKRWLLHLSGGEPTIYPGFVELCEQLTRDHYVSLNSNLSHRSIETFAERVNPRQVHFINAAVHDEERREQKSRTVFIARVQKLQKYQFNVLVSLVMTPLMVENFPAIAQAFAPHGVPLIPKVLRGSFQGRIYPAAYSAEHKTLIRAYLAKARQQYAAVSAALNEQATINMFADDRFLNGLNLYYGKLCGSGYNFVTIEPDGTVIRCGSGKQLGNILRKNVRFLSAPRPCDSVYCPYFCAKYTSPPFVPVQEARRNVDGFLSTLRTYPNNHLTGFWNRRLACFDRLSTNGNSSALTTPNPFALSLSKGERKGKRRLLSRYSDSH